MNIKTVTVIGANGVMGANISAIFASFGNAKVYMVSRNIKDSEEAVARAVASVRAGVIYDKLIPVGYDMLEKCISESDLVFESVKEDFKIKNDLTKIIASYISDKTIVCTGTSGLSVTKLAECLSEKDRGRYFGVHMFNPPYNLSLCELIATKYSDASVLSDLKKYLNDTLLRTVVEVKDSAAFLGNRIGFQFMNEAMQYAEKYKDKGGIDYIDAILGAYTGRSMAPLVTADFVGLDVHKAIVDNIYSNTSDYAHETFILPEFCNNLIKEGYLGRKTNGGLYKTKKDGESKEVLVFDIKTNCYRKKVKYDFPYLKVMIQALKVGDYETAFKTLIDDNSEEANICLSFLLKYIVYSLKAVSEVGFDIHAADDVMATGFNWCPPLAMLDAFRNITDVKKLFMEHFDEFILKSVNIELLDTFIGSKYDYRQYFKSKK